MRALIQQATFKDTVIREAISIFKQHCLLLDDVLDDFSPQPQQSEPLLTFQLQVILKVEMGHFLLLSLFCSGGTTIQLDLVIQMKAEMGSNNSPICKFGLLYFLQIASNIIHFLSTACSALHFLCRGLFACNAQPCKALRQFSRNQTSMRASSF